MPLIGQGDEHFQLVDHDAVIAPKSGSGNDTGGTGLLTRLPCPKSGECSVE
jgi:hypothetical protein